MGKQDTTAQQSEQKGDHNTINDPKSNNILSYLLGSSVLASSVGGIYYRRQQHKELCKNGK